MDLEKPVPFFPAIISYAATAIVPEGTGAIGSTAREGAVGTGPFRVVSFEPGRRLELERNPQLLARGPPPQRRHRLPLRHHARGDPRRVPRRAASRSRATSFPPTPRPSGTIPRFASGYRESPRLTTYFVVFNRRRGPLAGRRSCGARLFRAIDVAGLVRRTLGRLAIPAHGLIPPGLLGYSAAGPSTAAAARAPRLRPDSSVEATVSREIGRARRPPSIPIFFGEFAGVLPRALRSVPRDRATASAPPTRRWPST